jgi:hypothetical protein
MGGTALAGGIPVPWTQIVTPEAAAGRAARQAAVAWRQERLELGLALALKPRLLLLDEPTAGMAPADHRQEARLRAGGISTGIPISLPAISWLADRVHGRQRWNGKLLPWPPSTGMA